MNFQPARACGKAGKAGKACLTFALIHIMLYKGYDVFTVGCPAVPVEPKVASPIVSTLTQTLSVAYEYSQVYVCFILGSY